MDLYEFVVKQSRSLVIVVCACLAVAYTVRWDSVKVFWTGVTNARRRYCDNASLLVVWFVLITLDMLFSKCRLQVTSPIFMKFVTVVNNRKSNKLLTLDRSRFTRSDGSSVLKIVQSCLARPWFEVSSPYFWQSDRYCAIRSNFDTNYGYRQNSRWRPYYYYYYYYYCVSACKSRPIKTCILISSSPVFLFRTHVHSVKGLSCCAWCIVK